MKVLKDHIDKLVGTVNAGNLFPEEPTIDFVPEVSTCCNLPLQVQKTRTKEKATTMDIGTFIAKETVLKCQECGYIYTSDELQELIPPRCDFGYDVLVHVGMSLFVECRNEKEIQRELKDRNNNITISQSEIAYLAKKFIVYLALAHRESSPRIKKAIQNRGGYILHVDSMCDGDSPHLMSGLDEISDIVLGNIKIPTEKAEKIIPFFEMFKKTFGRPLAIVRDMSSAISNAVKEVFKGIRDFICHYHFLRDIGNDLFGKENDIIRSRLRHYGIQGQLRRMAAQSKRVIDKHPGLIDCFDTPEGSETIEEWTFPHVVVYTIIQWALDGRNQGKGYGFPFDRPYLTFYQRLERTYSICEQLGKTRLRGRPKYTGPLFKICRLLQGTLKGRKLHTAVERMKEKCPVFDKLREAMDIAEPEGKRGLNDDGEDADIKTIEKRVEDFREWLIREDCFKKDKCYQKMVEQIDSYWKKLFADPITVNTPRGKITIQPQRTNNILERFFRSIRYWSRKKSGKNSLSKTLKAMLADMPLVKNLKNPEYVKIILNGKTRLEERFAEIDAKIVREELKKSQEDSEKIPAKIKAIIKEPELPEIVVNFFTRYLNS